ncbi:MAG: response regulator, partial [Acidobacteriota bacterium]|nr:response regulator [Acidobacteriota bacterium]
ARMSEISMDGCFIDSMGQETLGETVKFKVHLPSGVWASLQGEVVAQEYPIGFQLHFTNLNEADRRILAQVIAAHGGQAVAEEIVPAEILYEGDIEIQPDAEAARETHRILVADDDSMTLRMLTAIIEAQGFKVIPASDGREAFRILQQDDNFCAAVFDMKMPHLHGLDLIHYMKTDSRLTQIPIAMITAEQDPKIWDESIAAGANVFLPKPFNPPQVQMMLRMLISKAEC